MPHSLFAPQLSYVPYVANAPNLSIRHPIFFLLHVTVMATPGEQRWRPSCCPNNRLHSAQPSLCPPLHIIWHPFSCGGGACPTPPAWAGVRVGGNGRHTDKNFAHSPCSWYSAAFHAWRTCWWSRACWWAPETVFLLNVCSLIVAFGETICWKPYTATHYMNSRTPSEL